MSNANNFDIPSWAGKPPVGLHLDVTKDGKLIQKLMLDQKKCYFFGRNKELSDFHVPHDSCSRVHAALVWHKHLNRPFLIDLGSTHGTFVGHIRLDIKKPQQIPPDSELHFGASTRKYMIRERPQASGGDNEDGWSSGNAVNNFGLPETESELEHLTEFNTAQNRIIDKSVVGLRDMKAQKPRKLKRAHITFNEDEQVINPEDIDPSVGRFRNLISTTVIPTKKQRLETAAHQLSTENSHGEIRNYHEDVDPYIDASSTYSTAAKLGISVPNLAPDIQNEILMPHVDINPKINVPMAEVNQEPQGPRKKKYAKEAWPGKKPAHLLV